MNKIKIGIVGAGMWGETHARIYQDHPCAEIVAVCDLNKSKAENLAQKFGIRQVYTDYREFAKKSSCEAVAVVTPDFLHADIAIACANAKKHMIIEKPFATTREDVHKMVDAIEKNKVRVMVDFHNRWSPPFVSGKQAVDSGELGEPCSAYFRLNDIKWVPTDMLPWAGQSSIIWFLGSHSLDTLRWYFNDEVDRVYSVSRAGLLKSMGVDTVDMYMTTLEFKHGGIAQMENGWITPNGNTNINDIKFNFLCSKGMIDIDASSHNMIHLVTDARTVTPDVIVRNFVHNRPKGFAFESIRSFVDRLVDGDEFEVTLRDAVNTSLSLITVLESAKVKKPLTVQY